MHSLSLVLNLLLASAAFATPQGAEIFRRASCGNGQSSALTCIQAAGPSAASSFCASYITTKSTTISFKSTVTSTITSSSTRGDTVRVTAPTSTRTSTVLAPGFTTTTTTDATSFTATIPTTTTVSTITSTITATATSYTCAGAGAGAGAPAVTPVASVAKRQAACTSTFNSNTISGACNNCGGGYPTKTLTSSVTSTTTKTTTTVVKVTNFSTSTPVAVTTTTLSSTSTALSQVTLATDTTTTFTATATSFTTTTTTTIVPSPTPTAFNLYYVDDAGTNHYAYTLTSPGGVGTMVAFTTAPLTRAVFSLDARNALADAAGADYGTNLVDEYPYLFDNAGQSTTTCSACAGTLTCTAMTGGAQFALCNGFLALGTTFGPDATGATCTNVNLMFSAVGATQ